MQAGASGFVVKDTPARQLAEAVRRVHSGLRVVDPLLAAESLTPGDSPLTEREAEVLKAASDGGTVADIAKAATHRQAEGRPSVTYGVRHEFTHYENAGVNEGGQLPAEQGVTDDPTSLHRRRCVLSEGHRHRAVDR